MSNGKALLTLRGHTSIISSVTFSPDGKRLATGSYDRTAKIWDLRSGKPIITLEGHNDEITCVAFSSDGQRFASSSLDGTAKIWEINPDVLINHWHRMPQSTLLSPTLQRFNFEDLLDQRLNNESKLIATHETWQIKAFADLAASQAAGSNILPRVEPHYARADRLYAAALALQDEELIRMDYANMLRRWAEVCKSDGLEGRATELAAKADRLWKETKE